MKLNNIINLDEIDSTSDWLKGSYSNYSFGDTVVFAKKQRKGRGQYDRKWISKEGGIYFSLLLYINFKQVSTQEIIISMSEHVQDYLFKNYKISLRIKPPNDLYFEDKKIMGVLIENSFLGNNLEYCIMGVGLNVNQIFLKEGSFLATSLREILGISLDPIKLAKDILTSWEPNFSINKKI